MYSINVSATIYEIKIHYKKKISIFKNNHKITEFDASFLDKDY